MTLTLTLWHVGVALVAMAGGGSATSAGAIPAGAVVLRAVTS